MIPHLDKALLEFEEWAKGWQLEYFQACPPPDPPPEWERLRAALAIEQRARDEARAGRELEGFPGCLWRLISHCDYQRVEPWMRGEIVRASPQPMILDCAAAAVASIVLQVAALVVRSQMREVAQVVMKRAVEMLERDIQEVMARKKAGAVIRQGLHVVPGGKT